MSKGEHSTEEQLSFSFIETQPEQKVVLPYKEPCPMFSVAAYFNVRGPKAEIKKIYFSFPEESDFVEVEYDGEVSFVKIIDFYPLMKHFMEIYKTKE